MNNLSIKLQNNRFSSVFGCDFKDFNIRGNLIIDTGCMLTSISLNKDILPGKDIKFEKWSDICEYRRKGTPIPSRSIGVNDRDIPYKNILKMSDEELLEDKSIGFIHNVKNFSVGGFYFGSVDVKIVYGRPGHSLLGMNILRLYESRITNSNGVVEFILGNVETNKGLLERCKFKIKSMLSKGLSIGEMRRVLSSEYSEECLDRSFCEIFDEHCITNYRDDEGNIVKL